MTTWTAGRIAHEFERGRKAAAKSEAALMVEVAALRKAVAALERSLAAAESPVAGVEWQTGTPPPMTRLVCVVADRICVCTYRQRANGAGQWFDEGGRPVTVAKWTEVRCD